jgi:hypothetical protein
VFPYRSGIVGIIIDTNIAIIKKLFMFSKLQLGYPWTAVIMGNINTINLL